MVVPMRLAGSPAFGAHVQTLEKLSPREKTAVLEQLIGSYTPAQIGKGAQKAKVTEETVPSGVVPMFWPLGSEPSKAAAATVTLEVEPT